jgi:hypothetical protein
MHLSFSLHARCNTIITFAMMAALMLTSCSMIESPQSTSGKTGNASQDPRAAIVSALIGSWSNRVQFDAAPALLKVPPSVNGEWLDLQHARFVKIDAPAIGDQVLYLEWRNGGPQGEISRQRIWSFRVDATGAVRMDFYAFVDGKPWAAAVETAKTAEATPVFTSLSKADLRGYGEACALLFAPQTAGFRGLISAKDCTITAASGRKMGIDARVELLADGTLEYRESGQLEDGRYAFRVPTSQPYQFVKLQ